MIFALYLPLLCIAIVQSVLPDTWSATPTNCVWHQYTSADHVSKRIDLRDIRNQLLT